METRVLTLFDDEEFFPKEPPKQKPKKEKASKAETEPDDAVDCISNLEGTITAPSSSSFTEEINIVESAIVEPSNASVEEPIAETNESDLMFANEGIVEDNADEYTEETIVEEGNETDKSSLLSEEKNIVADGATVNAIEVNESTEIESSTEGENNIETPVEETITKEDKELNQQILSELIQLDYTALMQQEHSFDISKAKVIHKELPKKNKEPDLLPEIEEEPEEEEVFEDVIPLPEWKLDKKYYTIGEVAQLFEVNTSHIRFWTNEFKLRPRTTRKGDRLYSPKDIASLRLIHHLVKVKKHTIKGAREKLKAEQSDVTNKLDLKESLTQLKDTLLKIRAQL